MNAYDEAKRTYQNLGVDVERALEVLKNIPVSIQCWQLDDVKGFEDGGNSLSGGIQTTGNYAGRARNFDELKSDLLKAFQFIPGTKRLNLHAIYAVSKTRVERDRLEPKHFKPWLEFAQSCHIKLDFNPTFFSSGMVKDNLTLSSPDETIRAYWVRHGVACRNIAEYIGSEQKSPCLFNVWIPDGMKDTPADRLAPRIRLKQSLDQIFETDMDERHVIDSVESKVFGIGIESYTVGSQEFYMNYAQQKGICCLIDNGHYHPTENVADKLSSMLLFNRFVPLHVTRAVRWDSDHVVSFDDVTREIAREIVQSGQPERFLIGLDYFDASINRVAALVIGARNFQKALLSALLLPQERMRTLQDEGKYTELLVLNEEAKTLPFHAVWEAYCLKENVKSDHAWYQDILDYEQNVLNQRS